MTYTRGNSWQSSGVQTKGMQAIASEVVMSQKLPGCLSRFLPAETGIVFLLCSALSLSPVLSAQTDDTYQARRTQAFALYDANKLVDALTLLEKLHAEKPSDLAVFERLSFVTLAHAATLSDPAARKLERAHARKLADEAKAAGVDSNLLKAVLLVPEDGGEMNFSGTPEVQAIMQEGESAFAKGDMEAAVAAYSRALALDPKQYDAALFIGDVYFKKKDHEQADKWFARAVEIDPNRETGYRYWGDDLAAQGLSSEAREQFIGAVVAEPYNQRSWVGLSQWAKHENKFLGSPKIESPDKIEHGDKNQTNIIIDPSAFQSNGKKDGTDAWFFYPIVRAGWHGEKFQKEFPAEKEYRHSLPEEVDGFQSVVNQVQEKLKKQEIQQLDPALAILVKISGERLLESFILISRPDKGISQDYPPYRDAHREKIRQYITEWIIHPAQ